MGQRSQGRLSVKDGQDVTLDFKKKAHRTSFVGQVSSGEFLGMIGILSDEMCGQFCQTILAFEWQLKPLRTIVYGK
jgi:hypothetical protein